MNQIFKNKKMFFKNSILVMSVFVLSHFIFRYVFKVERCVVYSIFDSAPSCEPNNLLILFYAAVLTFLTVYIYKKIERKIHD